MIYRKYKLIFLLLLMGSASQAQEKFSTAVAEKFNDYSRKNVTEKLFVHTDREFYLAGEILWYKIYEVEGLHHMPLPLNRVAYVELLDKNNQPILQQKMAMTNGYGNGSFFLPASISTGTYLFRAYTNWMKNFSPEFYFQKKIDVVNTFVKRFHPTATEPPALDAAFFPEGGNLVAGVESKIGFKVTNESGRGIDFIGALIDEHNDTIARFSPLKFGMGNFLFTPLREGKYKALIKAGKQRKLVDFPAVASGYSLKLTSSVNKIKVSVFHPSALANEAVYIFIHAHQLVSKAEVKFLKNDSVSFSFSKSEMPEGISHVTVFTSDSRPVCERLYFKKPSVRLTVDLQTDKLVYSKREKVTLTVKANSQANVSASVYRLDSLGEETAPHIAEYLWMTSDLRGFIESPDFYFSDNRLAEEAQDNLMLTQGWRRFAWKDVLDQRPMVHFPPEYGGHLIQATIRDEKNQPAPNAIGLASVVGKNVNLTCARSDENGEMFFEVHNLVGTQKLVLQASANDSLKHIEIGSAFSEQYASNTLPDFPLMPESKKNLLARSVGLQAQHIYTENEIKKTRLPAVDSIPFYGLAGRKFLLDDYTRFPVMEEVMREYVSGLMVRKRADNKFRFRVLDETNQTVFSESPLILLDGVPLSAEDEIMNFDPLRIKRIDVITQKYFLGPAVFSGVVSYTTYKGNLAGFQLNPKGVVLDYDGLELEREFYSPDYSVKSDVRIPDFRSLVYWTPTLEPNPSQPKKIEFFTPDLPGTYKVIVQGVNEKGVAGSGVLLFRVE